MKKLSPEFVSAVQEFLRTIAAGEILTLVTVLGIITAGINKELGTFMIEWNVAGAVFVAETIVVVKTALVKSVDKYIHKNGISTVLDIRALDSLK